MPNITLPDGSIRQYDNAVTVAEVAASIGAGLARAALAGRVDGKLVDTSHRIERDIHLSIVTDKDADGLEPPQPHADVCTKSKCQSRPR